MHHCVVCQEEHPKRIMAKTACAKKHGVVVCKPCLLKWFEQKLSCPLCNAAVPITTVLRRTDFRLRKQLKDARVRVKAENQASLYLDDARVAQEMQQQEMRERDAYIDFLLGLR